MADHSLTVIVPHRNRPDYLRQALLSIRAQSIVPSEILVVDDYSLPAHREKLDDLADLATILLLERNVGLSEARNIGAKAAKGEWVAFLDDDDLFFPDKSDRQFRYLREHPDCDALGGGLIMASSDGRREYWGGHETRQLTVRDALLYTASMAQALMIRRDVFLQLGGFEARLRALEDYEFGIRAIASGCRMHFLAEPMFIYRRGGREQMSMEFGRMVRAEMAVLQRHSGLCKQQFGRFGSLRLHGRCYKKRGLGRGGLVGRSVWAMGCILEGLFGRQPEECDASSRQNNAGREGQLPDDVLG